MRALHRPSLILLILLMLRKFLFPGLLALILASCAPGNATPVPTLLPESLIPTIIAMTADSARATLGAQTPTAENTATATPTLTPEPTRDYPTQTFTPQPYIPQAQIQFLSPGPMSKFISPVQMQLMVIAGESDKIQIDLFGEDGRLLGRKVDHVNRHLSGVYAVYKIPFEIRAAAEKGLLQISSRDKEGRMQALNSVPIVLLSAGVTETTPPGNIIYERAVFYTPHDEDSVSGGELVVKGRIWPFNTEPVFLELVLPDGKIPAVRVLNMEGLDPQEFSTTLPYKVSEPTLARLSIRQMDPVLNAPIYVFTQAIWLNP